MDSFEQIVSELLWDEGLWVWRSFKVKLTPEDKAAIWQAEQSAMAGFDIVGYDGRDNVVHVIECKSYFDSPGVGAGWINDDPTASKAGFLELFTDDTLRKVVFAWSEQQLTEEKRCRTGPKLRLGLACGHTKKAEREKLRSHFAAEGWDLYDEEWLRDRLRRVADGAMRIRFSGCRGEAVSARGRGLIATQNVLVLFPYCR